MRKKFAVTVLMLIVVIICLTIIRYSVGADKAVGCIPETTTTTSVETTTTTTVEPECVCKEILYMKCNGEWEQVKERYVDCNGYDKGEKYQLSE